MFLSIPDYICLVNLYIGLCWATVLPFPQLICLKYKVFRLNKTLSSCIRLHTIYLCTVLTIMCIWNILRINTDSLHLCMCVCIYIKRHIMHVCICIYVYISMLNVIVRKKVQSIMTAITFINHAFNKDSWAISICKVLRWAVWGEEIYKTSNSLAYT